MPRDANGYIYTGDNIRIRPELHTLQPGEIYCPRHHGKHYHLEHRIDISKGWQKNNINKIKPRGYKPGEGTGFLPGESFPS